MIKVLLVDDHELIRGGVEALLNAFEDMSVVAVCDCGEKALQIMEAELPDVVLVRMIDTKLTKIEKDI